MDAGILIARVIPGVAIGARGTGKLFGWFGGYGPRGTGAYFALFAAFAGTGAYSLDRLLGLDTQWEARTAGAAIAVAVPLALVNVALRRPAPSTKAHA